MIYRFEDCQLNTRLYTIQQAGDIKRLRPKVFQVLLYLLEHRDRVLSKQELAEQVWPDLSVAETTLEGTIREVRQAVGDSGREQRVIQTLSGHGYRFIANLSAQYEEDEAAQEDERSPIADSPVSHRWQCPVCQHSNLLVEDELDWVCAQCGTARQLACPHCHGENPPQAKFCQSCGHAFDEGPKAPPSMPLEAVEAPPSRGVTEPEHRQLTVLSLDLVNAIALSDQLTADDVRDILRAYWETCKETIQRFDGYIAQSVGTKLLAYFGYPQAHEDDARRAVYAGLDLLRVLKSMSNRFERDQAIELSVCLGIHTGLVVVGDLRPGDAHEVLMLGDTLDMASKIQSLAAIDTLVISETTAQLVEGYFIWDRLDQRVESAAAPLNLLQVLSTSAARSRLDAISAEKLTPLVGRGVEFGLLQERWSRAQEGMGQVVLLNGEAGIGKSRLLEAFKNDLPTNSYTLIECRCSPYDQHSVFYPVIDLLRDVLQWEQDDADAVRLAKLEKLLTRYDQPLEETVPLFAALISLPLADTAYPPLPLSPSQQRQQTMQAFLAWMLTLAAGQPTLFIVEDLHWIDPSTLDLLTLLIDYLPATSTCALFTHRPTFQVPWNNRSYITSMTLSRLPDRDVEQLVSHVSRGKTLPRDVLRQVMDQTDGVPLFIEECTKTILESGWFREDANRYELLDSMPTLTVPRTLQDSLIARLDRLGTAKPIAQIGAVLGRRFSYLLIREVSQQDETVLLHELGNLVESELIYQQGLPPQSSYVFKHSLIQEAAYQSLLKGTKQPYHQRTAAALAEHFAETVASQPELLAYHYEAAGLTAPAVEYWKRAGRRALERSAYVEAIRHLRHGLELVPSLEELDVQVSQELSLQIDLGRAFMATNGYAAPEVAQSYNRAQMLCRQLPGSPRLFAILRGMAAYYSTRAEYASAIELGEQCLALANEVEDPLLLLRAHVTLGQAQFFLGDFTQAHAHFMYGIADPSPSMESERAVRAIQDPQVTCYALDAIMLWFLGYLDQGRQRSEQAIQLAQKLDHPFSLAEAFCFAALLSLAEHHFESAERRSLEVMTLADAHDWPYWKAHAQIYYGYALAGQGRIEAGIERIQLGLEQWEAIGGILARTYLLSYLAKAYFLAGQVESALQVITDALHLVEIQDERFGEADLYCLKGEYLLHRKDGNQAAEAEACFQRAFEVAIAQKAKVFELRARMHLCRLWQQEGQSDRAYRVLEEGYSWFDEGLQTPDLRQAKALLSRFP